MNSPQAKPVIVLVDDDEDDALMLRSAIAQAKHPVSVVHLPAGEDLLSAVMRSDLPERCIILLDLNMSSMDGFTVLERLRTVPGGSLLPVVIYTTSSDQPHVDRAYATGANAYMTKPSSLLGISTVVGSLLQCWFIHGRLPAWRGEL